MTRMAASSGSRMLLLPLDAVDLGARVSHVQAEKGIIGAGLSA